MREILLTQGKKALVDDDDYNFLNSFKWYAKESGGGGGQWYAVRKEKSGHIRGLKKEARLLKVRKNIRMHTYILKPDDGIIVHHVDGNGLNNQRHNFEMCTPLENLQFVNKKRWGDKDQKEEIPF